jgi:hypothetical protein
MTSDSNAHRDDAYWERWPSNTYEPKDLEPMKNPLTAPVDLAVSDSDLEILKAGFRPRNFDDKYAWLIEDENGNISIHVIRWFVKVEEYILHMAPKSSNDNGASAKIHSITWEGDMIGAPHDAEQAKKRVVVLAKSCFHRKFESLDAE